MTPAKPALRVVFTGSRPWTNEALIRKVIAYLADTYALEAAHGACPNGADKMVEHACLANGITPERFRANWTIGKAAGHVRNREMIDAFRPERVLAFWRDDVPCPGTEDCVRYAISQTVPTALYRPQGRPLVDPKQILFLFERAPQTAAEALF